VFAANRPAGKCFRQAHHVDVIVPCFRKVVTPGRIRSTATTGGLLAAVGVFQSASPLIPEIPSPCRAAIGKFDKPIEGLSLRTRILIGGKVHHSGLWEAAETICPWARYRALSLAKSARYAQTIPGQVAIRERRRHGRFDLAQISAEFFPFQHFVFTGH